MKDKRLKALIGNWIWALRHEYHKSDYCQFWANCITAHIDSIQAGYKWDCIAQRYMR